MLDCTPPIEPTFCRLTDKLALSPTFTRLRDLTWVPVTYLIPQDLQDVRACNAEMQINYGDVTYRDSKFMDQRGRVFGIEEVTHWMPLPRLPRPELRTSQN